MGNKHSCCVYKNSTGYHKKDEDRYIPTNTEEPPQQPPPQVPSSTNLQHISEREPDDTEGDPSNHPTAGTIFISRSKSEIQRNSKMRRRSQYDNHHHNKEYGRLSSTKKYSSCSTIFIDDSTVSQPNLKNTLKAVALAIYFHIRNREHKGAGLPGTPMAPGTPQTPGAGGDNNTVHVDQINILDIFDEKLHPLSRDPVPQDYDKKDPSHNTIYRFIRTLFNAAQLTAECAIVTLVYLERILTYAEIEIGPSNWKRIVLGAILLASKVWDDQAVWNVDYCQIIKDVTVEDMNEMERQYLECLQFDINVSSSVYAKYYFELRYLAEAHDLILPLKLLDKHRALKLEAMASVCEDKLRQQIQQTQLRRSHSLDGLTQLNRPSSKAILS